MINKIQKGKSNMKRRLYKRMAWLLICMLSFSLAQSSVMAKSSHPTKNIEIEPSKKIVRSNIKGQSVVEKTKLCDGIIETKTDTLDNVQYIDNQKIESHTTTISYEVNVDEIGNEKEITTFSKLIFPSVCHAASHKYYMEEDAIGFKILCYSTVEWKDVVVNNRQCVQIIKAYGGVKSLNGYSGAYQGGGATLQVGSVKVVQNGLAGTGEVIGNQKWTKTTAAAPHTWSYTPSGWSAITQYSGFSNVGVNETVKYTLASGTTVYTLTFPNNIIVDGSLVVG